MSLPKTEDSPAGPLGHPTGPGVLILSAALSKAFLLPEVLFAAKVYIIAALIGIAVTIGLAQAGLHLFTLVDEPSARRLNNEPLK